MPGNVSKAAKRLSKWRADTCQVLCRASCGSSLADTVRVILRKTANIFKTIKDDTCDEEQRGQLSRELVTVLCQVSSSLHFRARDLLLAIGSAAGAATRFEYWDNQCALLSYVLDLALALNEPATVAKVLFTLSKSKHRVWDALVQTEAIASTSALDERDRVLDVFRWLAAYCPRTCSNPELYFKFIACAACLARRLHEDGWKTVKSTALSVEPTEFDFEEWFAAQPALAVLLPPSAEPRPRRKLIALLCKSASGHAELLKACEAISDSGGGYIRPACDAEATTEDDFFTIVDDGLEARQQATADPQVKDQQLQVTLESTLSCIHLSLPSTRIADHELESELISEASASPQNTQAFLGKVLSSASVGCSTSAASCGMQKPGKRLDCMGKELLEEASELDRRAADKGDRSKGGTQEKAASEGESSAEATPDLVDSPHEMKKQGRNKKFPWHKANRGETAPSLTETVQACGALSAVTVGSEEGETPSLKLSSRKHMETATSVSAVEVSDAASLWRDQRTPLKGLRRYSNTDDSLEKELRGRDTAKVNGKLPPSQEHRAAPQDSPSSQVRPVTKNVKAASVQCSSGRAVGKLSLGESKDNLESRSDSEREAVVEAVANRRSRAVRAELLEKAEEGCIIDWPEEESHREDCLEESSARSPSDDVDEMPLSLGVESECEGSCSGSKSAGVVKAASPHQKMGCNADKVASPNTTGNPEGQSSSEVDSDTEVAFECTSKGGRLRKVRQHIIVDSSEEESCGEQNAEEGDIHSASDDADKTTSSLSVEPLGKALSSTSDSEAAGLQAQPAKKVVKAALMRHQSSLIASTMSPEGCGKSEGSSSSDDESAAETVSEHSSRACGARKAQRRMISDSSIDESYSEQSLKDDIHLASGDDVGGPIATGAKCVRGVPSLSSNSEPGEGCSPSSSVKRRAATLLSSAGGGPFISHKTVHKGNRLRRSRISSSLEEESQVKCASKGNTQLVPLRCTKELNVSSSSECESPEENSDNQSTTSSSSRKSVTKASLLPSNGKAVRPSVHLRRTVSRATKEHRDRIGDMLQQEPRIIQVSKGNNKNSASERTCTLRTSSSSESDFPLSRNAPSQTMKKVRRSRIVSSSEFDDEEGAEVSVQPGVAGHEVPSESDDDEISRGQRPPNVSSLQHIRLSSPDGESAEGPHSLKLRRKPCLATESDADTVDMLSGDEEVLLGKQSSAYLSEATTVATSPDRRSLLLFSQPRGAQTSQGSRHTENNTDTGTNQGSAGNSVFKLPTLKKTCSAGARREEKPKSHDGCGGLDKHAVLGSSSFEKSAKEEIEPVAYTALTRRTLRSRRSESQHEHLLESYQEVAKLGSGDTRLKPSDGAMASTSFNCSAPALEGMPSVQSDTISLEQEKMSTCKESSDALYLHNGFAGASEVRKRSARQCSLKTEQTVAREALEVSGKGRTAPRKRSTSGLSLTEKAMHETPSECDTDTSRSSKEESGKRVQHCSGTKSACRVQMSLTDSNEVSDGDIDLESPQKHPCPLSNERRTSSVMRRNSGAHLEGSGTRENEQTCLNSLHKSPSSPAKRDSTTKLVVHTSSRRQLLADVSASALSERNEVAEYGRAEGPGKAPDFPEQASPPSEQGDITDDSSEQESPRKRLCPTSSKKKQTSPETRKKPGTNLEVPRKCRNEQLTPSNLKSPSSPVMDDIPARVLTRSARRQLSTSREASAPPEKNRMSETTRAHRPEKAADTLGAGSALERHRCISEEILDSDAESGMSDAVDHSASVAPGLSFVPQCKEAVLVEEWLNEHKVAGGCQSHSTRLCASQTGFSATSQARLHLSKNDVGTVAPVASNQESLKVHTYTSAVQNESVARSGAVLSKHCSTQGLSQSSSNLNGLTQAPSSPSLRLSGDLPRLQRETDASQQSQRGLQQLDKEGCAVNTVEALYSPFGSHGEDTRDDAASLAESRGLSPLSQNRESPTSPKADESHHRAYRSDARNSGRLSLSVIRSSASEPSECLKSSSPVSNRRAVTKGTLEQPALSTAICPHLSSCTCGSSLDSKKQAREMKKRSTRASASHGSQNNIAAETVTSLSQQVVDATDIKGLSAKVPATRRSARLMLMKSSLGSHEQSSRLTAVAHEEGNSSDAESDGRSTRSHSMQTTPSSKGYHAAHPQTPPVQVVLDRLEDVSMTGRRPSDTCSACQRSFTATQNSGTMTDESYFHDEADFSGSSTSMKRRKTDRRSAAAVSQQKTVTSTRRARQCSTVTQQPSAPVRRSTRRAVSVSRRLSYA